jgi:ABC-type nitrate/sulfonate/bicarbonate transport system substrate-binding protein
MLTFLAREEKLPGSFLVYGFQIDTPEHSHEAILVLADSEIQQVSQLRNKRIGTFPGLAAKSYLTEALVKAGFSRADIVVEPLQVQLHLQALRGKQVDALLAYEPTISIATAAGFGRVVERAIFPRYLQNPFPVTVFAMPRAYALAHPKEAEAIVAAVADAIEVISRSPGEANQTVIKYTSLQDTNVASTLNQPLNVLAHDVDTKVLQEFVDWHKKVGLLESSIKIEGVLYRSGQKRSPAK